jgi:hypothetical protein
MDFVPFDRGDYSIVGDVCVCVCVWNMVFGQKIM